MDRIFSLYKPAMEYRRFGKTEKKVSVITLGGMRFKDGWNEPREQLPSESIRQATETVRRAFLEGINLIETAWGYVKSEHLYGKVLNHELGIDRKRYLLMTKGSPKTAAETRQRVEAQMKALETDFLDFYGWHGMNNASLMQQACTQGGPVEELLKMKEEGLIGHVGFSTHAPTDVILDAIGTGLFDFVNLHYYYFFQRNRAALESAASRDMGVFIISPNDKGGKLFQPPARLTDLTAPLHPVQWNARFCLGHPEIHTLSFGITTAGQADLISGIFPTATPMSLPDQEILQRMDACKRQVPHAQFDGYEMDGDPSGLNIPEILRFRWMLKGYGMKEFCRYRYNMFQEKDHWFPGIFPTEENLQKIDLSKVPADVPLLDLIRETHQELFRK
ncbi:MAG: aldo/keto reductase [Marinilabiliales bacterium]|nr:aldo/keto reductase [Marinilabiliales bacterium]